MKIRILKTQVDKETERGLWIKLPRSTKKFWLSNKCYFPNGGSASIYINKNFDYLARSGSKGKNQFEINGEDIIEILGCTPIEHTPKRLKAEKVSAEDDLLR